MAAAIQVREKLLSGGTVIPLSVCLVVGFLRHKHSIYTTRAGIMLNQKRDDDNCACDLVDYDLAKQGRCNDC